VWRKLGDQDVPEIWMTSFAKKRPDVAIGKSRERGDFQLKKVVL
jgi:hypothetical protein